MPQDYTRVVSRKKKKKKPRGMKLVRQKEAELRRLGAKRDKIHSELGDATETMIGVSNAGDNIDLSAEERYALRNTGLIGGILRVALEEAAQDDEKIRSGLPDPLTEEQQEVWDAAIAEFNTDVAGNTAHQNFLDSNHKNSG